MEALVAAAIVGIALLFVVGLLAHEARLTARAAGQRDAVTLLETALEGVRAGGVALEDATYDEAKPPRLGGPRGAGAPREHAPKDEPNPPGPPPPGRRGAVLGMEEKRAAPPPVRDLYE